MAKVLLAEDDASMLFLLQTLLKMEGYQVSVLDLQGDLVASVRAEAPDALLMDVYLAGKSGIEVLQELREQEDLERTTIIMTSGMNLEKESLAAGANAFLLKPYMPDELIGLLRRHAGQARS
jgi:DNA-binding response OmpR family regulator